MNVIPERIIFVSRGITILWTYSHIPNTNPGRAGNMLPATQCFVAPGLTGNKNMCFNPRPSKAEMKPWNNYLQIISCSRAVYTWTDYKTNTETAQEQNVGPVLGKIQKYERKRGDFVWNAIAHAQKPDFSVRRRRVHLNRPPGGGGVSSGDYWQPRCAH